MTMPPYLQLSDTVRDSLERGSPVVALETAVATHGLPRPENTEALTAMECEIRAAGAVPAICLVHDRCLRVGATIDQVAEVDRDPGKQKAGVRDLGAAIARGLPAGLTVSATLFAAHAAGIRVFATGGIGGVHRGADPASDVSADLHQLARVPV